MFVESAIDDEIAVTKYKFKQIHDVVNRHVCSFRDGQISFKSVFSHLECQNCRYRCEKGYNIERYHDFLQGDGTNRDLSHKVAAVHNSILVVFISPTLHKNSRKFDLDDVKIIDHCSQWSKRLFLEAWHSIREPYSINEHIYIPDILYAMMS